MVYCSISQSHSTSDYKLYNKIYDNTPILDWTLGTDMLHLYFDNSYFTVILYVRSVVGCYCEVLNILQM